MRAASHPQNTTKGMYEGTIEDFCARIVKHGGQAKLSEFRHPDSVPIMGCPGLDRLNYAFNKLKKM